MRHEFLQGTPDMKHSQEFDRWTNIHRTYCLWLQLLLTQVHNIVMSLYVMLVNKRREHSLVCCSCLICVHSGPTIHGVVYKAFLQSCWLIWCLVQSSLLIPSSLCESHKADWGETARGCSCYMLCTSRGQAAPQPAGIVRRKHSHSSSFMQISEGAFAQMMWALISGYCSITRLIKLSAHFHSKAAENTTGIHYTLNHVSVLLNWLKNWCQWSGSEQTNTDKTKHSPSVKHFKFFFVEIKG